VLPAGDLTLAATAGDVTIGDALLAPARVSVAGASRTLGSETAFASGGRVTLQSATGSVRTLAGSEVDLRGAPAGGDAGRLRVLATAAGATAQIDGTVQGGAAAGFQSGAVEIDAGGIAAFGALNTRLDASGVTGERVFRVRSGDVALAAGETATARRFELSADAGRVTIAGTIDASGATGGGSVEVNASGNTTLAAGGKILAQGTSSGTGALDAPSDGGSVRLASRGAAVNFDSLASIDVSAGAKGDAGTVVFSAPRTAGNNGVVASLAGTVKGTAGAGGASGQVIVEGNRSYDAAALGLPLAGGTYTLGSAQTAGGSGTLWTQYRQFMNSVSVGAVTGAMTLQDIAPGDVHVRAGIEVTTPANLTLGSAWNLTSAN
jgi:hypothetical protein